jgi:DNA-binding NtrC family response regulator
MRRALLVVGINDPESKLAVQEAATAGTWETVHATSEQEIVHSLAERLNGVEAVVLDLSSGQHAVDLLRTIVHSETAPPVIVLAGEEQLGAVPVARQTGAAACVRKPFTTGILTSVIEQVRKPQHMRQGSTCVVRRRCGKCGQAKHSRRLSASTQQGISRYFTVP